METIFIVGPTKVKCNLSRDFTAGDPFSFNGMPHLVEAVQLETTRRVVRLVEVPSEPESDNRVSHRRRRSRKAFAGAEES